MCERGGLKHHGHAKEKRVANKEKNRDLAIFNHKTNTGIQIPYPTIALHAMQHKAQPSTGTTNGDSDASKAPCVLLQLDLSDGGEDDETYDTVQLTLVPPTASTQFESPAQDGAQSPSEQEKMFDAITTCQNLHPDPAAAEDEDDDDDDDQDYSDRIIFEPALDFAAAEAVEGLPGVFRGTRTGDLPPPMPGSSTWITAENVNEFFDEDGNWVGAGGVGNENEDEDEEKEGEGQEGRKEPEVEQLGPGAGRVRPLDEINGQEQAADESESKRARVE